MSRYTGPSWKQSRRYGISLSGSGKEIARRNYVPGQHGPNQVLYQAELLPVANIKFLKLLCSVSPLLKVLVK